MKFEKVEQDKERVFVTLGVEDDSMDLIINKKLELHIKFNEGNMAVDVYKHATDKELEDEDHDYDEDFIQCMGWVSADDLGTYNKDKED